MAKPEDLEVVQGKEVPEGLIDKEAMLAGYRVDLANMLAARDKALIDYHHFGGKAAAVQELIAYHESP